MTSAEARIEVRDLDMAYGDRVNQRDLTFAVQRGDVFLIMGGSGGGKSTLLRHHVAVFPWPRSARIDYELTVDVTRFGGKLGGECELVARLGC